MESCFPNLIEISQDRTLKKLWSLKQKMIKNPDILEPFERESIKKKRYLFSKP